MTLSKLAERIGGRLHGDGERLVRGLASLESADENEVSFLANQKYAPYMETTSAAAVIVDEEYEGPGERLIRCGDPYYAFREAMVAFYGFREPAFSGIDPDAKIDSSAEVGENVCVGPFVTVSRGAKIGDGCVLYPGVFVGPDCRLGRDCVLHPNVTLYEHSVLGDRVTIHASTSIGQDGFGYATHKGEDGVIRHEKIPQVGWVELEDDVEIGAGCAIDRATIGPTVIGAGTKFSNLVAIGHGTKLGQHCLMVAQSGIAGSTMVGNYCVFAGQAGVVGHIRIGDGVRVGAQAGVTSDIDPGQELLGSPAMPRAEARRAIMSMTRLPQLRDQVKDLTRLVDELQQRIARIEADGKEE
jgi:UDP-3-O-[3-hydroxymyristoyl] glucosamine N-acyltransferase